MFAFFFSELPRENEKWVRNDPKRWPRVTYEDIVDYLILSKSYDGKEMKAFRSLYAYNYVHNGWLGDMLSCKIDHIHYVKAKVSPSQPGVGRADYSAWIAVSEESSILTGYCTCPAGEGRSCSHISAIAYAVSLAWSHGIAGKTCTDKERVWGRGADKATLQGPFEDIDFSRPKANAAPMSKTVRKNKSPGLLPIKQFLDPQDLKAHAKETVANILWTCKGTMLNKVLTAKAKTVQENVPVQHTCHDVVGTCPVKDVPCQPCEEFYSKYIDLTNEAKAAISTDTSSQSSVLWHDVRKLRISSSKVNALPKTSRADPDKFVTNQIYPRFKGNSATQHGLKHEAEGRAWFERVTGKSVTQTGVVIDKYEPYLAASPDGLVEEDTIVEIKCPMRPLNELITGGKYDIVCTNGTYSLSPKGRNGYFSQVQLAMHCTGRSMCKFVVWTKMESIVVDVPYDAAFVDTILVRIRKFYFKHLLVRLVDENCFNRLEICDQYNQYCKL